MIDDVLARICSKNMCDWGVLLLGVRGVPSRVERVSRSDISSFANDQLELILTSDPALDLIVALSEEAIRDPVELREALAAICELKSVDIERSGRIWRCWLLKTHVADLESDPVYGLLELTQFWSEWGWPNDAPRSMKRSADVSPEGYHSDTHYQNVLEEHRIWIEREQRHLKGR